MATMKQTILFLRNATIFENLAAATAALNTVTHAVGQPCVATYKDGESTKLLTVIGKTAGTGATAYEVIATSADLASALASITDLTGALDAHKKAIATDSALGHVKSGGDVTVNGETGVMTVPGLALKAPLADPTFTGIPKAPTAETGTSDTQIATTAFVAAEIASKLTAAQAMQFKGTIGTSGTIATLPENPNVGDTYVAVTGCPNVGSEVVEAGDMIICTKAKADSAPAEFAVIQRNLDGSVTGAASSVDGNIALFSGATGKVIKDSGKSLSDLVANTVKVQAGDGLKGGGALSGDVTIAHGDKPTTGEAVSGGGSGKFVSGINIDERGHIATVSFGEIPADECKVKVDSDGSADFMGNQFATANPSADNTLPVSFSINNHKVEATVVIATIDGGTY